MDVCELSPKVTFETINGSRFDERRKLNRVQVSLSYFHFAFDAPLSLDGPEKSSLHATLSIFR